MSRRIVAERRGNRGKKKSGKSRRTEESELKECEGSSESELPPIREGRYRRIGPPYNEEFPDVLELYKLEGIPELAIIEIRARNKGRRGGRRERRKALAAERGSSRGGKSLKCFVLRDADIDSSNSIGRI